MCCRAAVLHRLGKDRQELGAAGKAVLAMDGQGAALLQLLQPLARPLPHLDVHDGKRLVDMPASLLGAGGEDVLQATLVLLQRGPGEGVRRGQGEKW